MKCPEKNVQIRFSAFLIFTIFVFIFITQLALANEGNEKAFLKEIRYRSTADESSQPAMFYAPEIDTPVPLLVALHPWSGDYKQTTHNECAEWCFKNGWAYIHPNFRGPNIRPEATGSRLVIEDIVSAVEFAKQNANIDSKAIFLIGSSGGGYTSLMVASKRPDIWAGVSVWVPISDLKAWYYESKEKKTKYHKNIMASCGGVPGQNDAVDSEYFNRSPINFLKNAKSIPIDINAGITDQVVPVSHSLNAFNGLANPDDRLTDEEIRYFADKTKVPVHLEEEICDPPYGDKQPLFRRTSGNVRVTIFNGGHELLTPPAVKWLEDQYNQICKTPANVSDALISEPIAEFPPCIALWPDGMMPNSKGMKLNDIIENQRFQQVGTPGIYALFPSLDDNNGSAVLIIPGGGYHHETYYLSGLQLAKWFNTLGMSAFVLKYRLPHSPDLIVRQNGPLQDAQRAIQLIRANAKKWGVCKERIGVMGKSAGGHLAAMLGTSREDITSVDDSVSHEAFTPDFLILVSPVISMGKYTHQGSRENLLGQNPDLAIIEHYSVECQVTKNTPPAFVVHAADDNAVNPLNSLLFVQELLRCNIPVSFHLFTAGKHAINLRNNPPSTNMWSTLCGLWMKEQGIVR